MRRLSIVKQTLLALAAFAGIIGLFVYPHTAAAINLKSSGVIEGDTVKLGDIFEGLPRDADRVLGPAPLPGKEMVLDSRTLYRIAIALDLPWRPETGMDSIALKRSATVIDHGMMEGAVKTSMEQKGVTGDYRLVFDEGGSGQMVLPPNAMPTVELAALTYDGQSGRFSAELAAPSKDKPAATARLSGRVERMAKIPVLRDSINNGAIIGARDIDFIEIPEKDIRSNAVLKAEDLVGMTPRRALIEGQPVSTNDIEAPRLIARGDVVTMIFNAGGLQLTAQGKALENGAKGDRIRVMNTSSAKAITAEVSNTKEVTLIE